MVPSFYKISFRRVGAPFLVLSALWILGSDLLVQLVPEQLHLEINVAKGFLFILLTAALATVLGGRMLRRVAKAEQDRARGLAERAALYEILPGPVFALDREGRVTSWNRHFLERTGLRPEDVDRHPAQAFVAPDDRPAVRAAIAGLLAGEEGRMVEAGLLTTDGRVLPYLLSGAPTRDAAGTITGIVGLGLDHSQERGARATLHRHLAEIESILDQTIKAIGTAVAARDPYTAGHQLCVKRLACAIAARIGLDADRIRGLELAAQVHDIGKIAIPADILNLPRALTPVERDIIKGHAEWGYRILKDIPFSQPVARFVLQHHERLDGSGYPAGLSGDAILLESRILAVADIVEAMTAHRPQRAAFSLQEALDELRAGSGRLYDPGIVDACLALHAEGFSFGDAADRP